MDVQNPSSQSRSTFIPDSTLDGIADFYSLRENVTGKLDLEQWMVLPSQRTLHIFSLNKKLNGNLSIRNTICIDVDLIVKVFGENDDDMLFSLRLYSWPQLQTLIEQCGAHVKREVDLEFIDVVDRTAKSEMNTEVKPQTDALAFKFDGVFTKTEDPNSYEPLTEIIESSATQSDALGCNNTFVSESSLLHEASSLRFEDDYGTAKHMAHKADDKSVMSCSACDKDFYTLKQFKVHMRRHDTSKWKPCPICNKRYDNLNRHMNDKHFNIRNHVCDTCGSAYKQWSSLKEHIETNHMPHEKYFCDICQNGKDYRSRAHIKRHFATVHAQVRQRRTNDDKLVSSCHCNICNEKLPSTYILKKHVALRHNDGHHSPFHCTMCDKTFTLKSSLTVHLKLHTGKQHVCQFCGQSFNHPNYLRKHLNRHKEIKKRKCTMCEKEYVNNVDLRLHMKKVHGVIVPVRNNNKKL